MTGRKRGKRKDDDEHLSPSDCVTLSQHMIGMYHLPQMCHRCQVGVLSALLGQIMFHANKPDERDAFLMEIIQHSREISGGMEFNLEHGGVKQ